MLINTGHSVVVFGDVHGQADKLQRLISLVQQRFGNKIPIYSTGDLIDRGPDPKRAIDLCVQHNIRAVLGNHEEWLQHYLRTGQFNDFALQRIMGGVSTIRSYGLNSMSPGEIERKLKHLIPREHKTFILGMPLYYNILNGAYWLTHAGLGESIATTFVQLFKQEIGREPDPGELLDVIAQTSPEMLLWPHARLHPPNLHHFKNGAQVFGHVSIGSPVITGSHIAIDTGCGRNMLNPLTAIVLPSKEILQIR